MTGKKDTRKDPRFPAWHPRNARIEVRPGIPNNPNVPEEDKPKEEE